MSVSGSLFDMDKFNDVSKNVIAKMTAEEVLSLITEWAEEYDKPLYEALTADREKALAIFSIGRGGKKPRKDFAKFSEVKEYIGFFYDSLFGGSFEFPENIPADEIKRVFDAYINEYSEQDDMNLWFEELCRIGASLGYAPSTKEYKEAPEKFKGSPGDVSQIVRAAVTGRLNSPDLYSVMKILGEGKVKERINSAISAIK